MDTTNILNSLREQRERINNAIAALEDGVSNNRRGRRPGRPVAGNGRRGRRKLSAAARRKISQAAKARWAKAKKAGKTTL